MKKTIYLFTIAFLIFSLISCSNQVNTDTDTLSQEEEQRIIVSNIGMGSWDLSSSLSYPVADTHNIEAITELSSQIVLCTVNKILDIRFNDLGDIIFDYEISIDDIYLDVNDNLKKNKKVTLTTTQGIMKGNDFTSLIKDDMRAQKFGDANKVYADNEYITASTYQGIPMEVGKTYIAYLTDEFLEKEKKYAEIGKMFLYEYKNGVFYQGIKYEKLDITFDKLKEKMSNDIKNRTGRADEIGSDDYITELGEKQRMAKKDSTKTD